MGRLRDEIRQSKPFSSPEEEAWVGLRRTADVLLRGVVEALRPAGLSPAQYNVLRILRGAGAAGLTCREIGERMLTHDPDLTRLLDRLTRRGLVSRARDSRDRRVVHAHIAEAGLRLLEAVAPVLADLHRRQLGHLGPARLRTLHRLLDSARSGADS